MTLTRRKWLHSAAAVFGAARTSAQTAKPKRPNVLLIMSDDQGYGDLSCHGSPHLRTAALDRLAAQSTEFTRFYVSPVCAPTRASLLTGRYNVRTGVHGVTSGKETMPAEEITAAEAFRAAGYRTGLIGKWHLGEAWPNVPHAQGFETFIGMRNGHWNDYFDSLIEHNGKPYRTEGYIADALTNEAIRFVEQHRAEPFFLYVAYNTPHTPYQIPDRYWKPFAEAGHPIELAAIYGMIQNLDENIGRLLSALDRLRLADETIVIFLTDNGPNGERYTAGLRGRKGSVYEGGVRVPFFIRWPGRVPAGRKVEHIAAHIDVYPTLADLCGVSRPPGPSIDGVSLRPLLDGESDGWAERPIFTHRERNNQEDTLYPGAIRTQRFNLVNGTELYDIEKDPGESINIAAAHPDVVRQLRGRYEDWFHTALAERGFQRFPIPVGYPDENPVYLPATQAYFDGEIRFYGKNGYSHDWLTNWVRVQDSLYWEVEVVTAGDYTVSLEYLCAQDSLGAELALRAGDSEQRATLTKPTRMEPLPDRNLVTVAHYQTMEWATLQFAPLALRAGRTRFHLRAASKPGPDVASIKALIAERR